MCGFLGEFSFQNIELTNSETFSSLLELPKSFDNQSNKNYHQVLENVISKQIISDVPIASFLSGGIDSPLITAVAKTQKRDIEAFMFGIDNPKFDESEKAKKYANHINIRHTLKKVKEFVSNFLEGKHNNGWGVWHIYA